MHVGRVLIAVSACWIGATVAGPALAPGSVHQLVRLGVPAACLAIVAGVAMFVRWRIDGRAQSWWLALGLIVLGVPGLFDSLSGPVLAALWASALAVALIIFVAARLSPEVDSILSIRLGACAFVAALGAVAVIGRLATAYPPTIRIAGILLTFSFGLLACLWRSDRDRPWFVAPLVGCALCSCSLALAPDATIGVMQVGWVMLVVSAAAATAALRGLQATATRHRSMALDAERERDLLASFREELECRYAETMHEVRSIVLALEGGIQVFQPAIDAAGVPPTLANSLVAELQRLRTLADPDQASVPSDFRLSDALRPLLEVSRANGWPATLDVADDFYVRGRPADVAQIVHGLLANAAKYAPGPVELTARRAGQFVLLLVDDHGPGIKLAHRERIFERGERPGHEPDQQGHGFGLHIARGLARSLGGELWVEQCPRGGARFVLALRVAAAPPATQPFLARTA